MSAWDLLAEARIREWLQRDPAERDATTPPTDPALPLEVQLMQDVAELDRQAETTTDAEAAAAMRRKASELMLRLMVVLEQQGRPLAARHFAEQRRRR